MSRIQISGAGLIQVFPRLIATLLLGMAAMAGNSAAEARTEAPKTSVLYADSTVCAKLARAAEKSLGIPEHLLRAVSTVESGRFDQKLGRAEPWPWTINAAGKGAMFPTKAAAVAGIDQVLRQGISSIDVGCMQVNLAYHGEAFDGIEDALDPVKNVAYAAHLLVSLKEQHGSWSAAVAAYHSSKPERAIPYCQKVAKAWHGLGGTATEDAIKLRRIAVRKNFEKRRAEFTARQALILKQQKEKRLARQKPQLAAAARAALARGGRPPNAQDMPIRLMVSTGLYAATKNREDNAPVGYAANIAAIDVAPVSDPTINRDKTSTGLVTHGCFDIVMREPAIKNRPRDPKRG